MKNIKFSNFKICKSIFSKSLGLMFSKKKKTLLFVFKREKKIPIHTFFVFYPIDLVYLDKNKKIIETKKNLKPFSLYMPKNKAVYLIEKPT